MKVRSGLILLGLVITAGILFYVLGADKPREVRLTQVERGEIKSVIRVTGRVINDRTVTMTALVNGQIEGMLIQKGDHVKADQVLAYLDRRIADAELNKARAVLEREKKSLLEARARFSRLKNVKSSGGASQQAIDDAEAQMHVAEASLQVARAELDMARIQREKIEVRAPFAGVITEKTTEKGQWVEAGTKLFTLVGDQGREIEIKVDAGDSGSIKLGQPVDLTCDAFPGVSWQEKIHWIAPSILQDETNEAVNTFAVRISLGEQAPPLLLGQQVDTLVVIAQKPNTLRLPYASISGEPGSYRVAVIRDGQVHYQPIQTGLEDDTHIEILGGLKSGDAVILPEGKRLEEGQAVRAL